MLSDGQIQKWSTDIDTAAEDSEFTGFSDREEQKVIIIGSSDSNSKSEEDEDEE